MATRQATVDYLVHQAAAAGPVDGRTLFGEFALYCDEKLVGLICDDQLYLTITPPGRTLLDESHDAPPYDGAKPRMRVPREKWDDADWLSRAIRLTADALPAPKPKPPKPPKPPAGTGKR